MTVCRRGGHRAWRGAGRELRLGRRGNHEPAARLGEAGVDVVPLRSGVGVETDLSCAAGRGEVGAETFLSPGAAQARGSGWPPSGRRRWRLSAMKLIRSPWSSPGQGPRVCDGGLSTRSGTRPGRRPDAIHLHDLRHAAGTLAAQTGATLRELQARLGHATPAAAQRYQHAATRRDTLIAVALAEVLAQHQELSAAARIPLLRGRGIPGDRTPRPYHPGSGD